MPAAMISSTPNNSGLDWFTATPAWAQELQHAAAIMPATLTDWTGRACQPPQPPGRMRAFFAVPIPMSLIRSMTAADLPAVMQIQAQCYAPSLLESAAVIRRRLHNNPDQCWVAEDAQGVCA